jgi:hypothetical protein
VFGSVRISPYPAVAAQLAQQKKRPSASTLCPMMRTPHFSQTGAIAWIVHSKLSKTWCATAAKGLRLLELLLRSPGSGRSRTAAKSSATSAAQGFHVTQPIRPASSAVASIWEAAPCREGRHYSCRCSCGGAVVLVDEAAEPVAAVDLAPS